MIALTLLSTAWTSYIVIVFIKFYLNDYWILKPFALDLLIPFRFWIVKLKTLK